ncbi:putative flavonoid 3',5'-hydroxylase [Heracleum sosnowskyi]|uniref:Flavonoid 3',5'-hydroxylase n=1 Tax=Heracleum sosnowskyi TaxID=360622 RepID=A0AAD8MPD0_9APIA|nr:putative flavonoid 3',5'-hydroxylase [Heracleum sosnowskyi]
MSPLSISITAVILGAVWWFLHIYWITKPPSNCHLRLPPGPRGLPVIGHLHMLGNLPHRALNDLAKKHGPIMFLRLGYVPAVVISCSTAAELIYKTHDTVFASRPKAQSTECITYGEKGITFTPYGSYWRNVRKICAQELLSASKIESLAWMRHEELVLFLKTLKQAADTRTLVDITEKVGFLVENMTFRMLFGRSRDERFDLSGIFEEIVGIVGAFNIGDYVPFLGSLDLQGLTRRARKISKAIDKMLEIIIDEHEFVSNQKHKRTDMDFVDMLLSSKHKSTSAEDQNSPTFDRASVKAIVLDLIFGAIETSRTVIEWAMSEILKHPNVMVRLQEELTMVVGDNNIVEEAHLSKRKCPGTNLGLINIQLVVAQLVHCFEWELPNGKTPTELDMDEKFGLTMVRSNHLVLKPIVRGREKFPA